MTTWQKDTTGKEALYVDFLVPLEELDLEYNARIIYKYHARHPIHKSNSMAESDRKDGNFYFGQSDFYMAIVKYNRGLWFAEKESEQMALLYANRSACFKNMKMFNECLIDIELTKASKCPQRVMAKLDARKIECLELQHTSIEPTNTPKLSFETHRDFPCIANVLQVEFDRQLGSRLTTTKNLQVGQTVLIEDFYFSDSYMEECSTCTICQKLYKNLVPCEDCTLALLCHDCMQSGLHRFECSIREFPCFTFNKELETVQKPVIRSIFMAVQNFPNVADLMVFVEDAIENGMESLSISDEKSKYRSFISLNPSANNIDLMWIYRIYKLLLKIPEIAAYFSGEKYRRFLMHLIKHHIRIFLRNFMIDSVIGGTLPNYFTCAIGCLSPHIQHSCTPNTILYMDHGVIVGKVIRPIKPGEQLCTVNTPALCWSFAETKDYLERINGIHCQCETPPIFNDGMLGFDCNFVLLSNSITRKGDYETDQPLRKALFKRVFTEFGHSMWTSKLMKVCLDYYIEMHKRSSIITTIRRDFKNEESAIARKRYGNKFNFNEKID
ncbi:hypothetical protein HA402_005542 [Bradysia odoriphaga]|nr:hypothetical protein HA402_005542 [Bradysia odoriphaga]